MKLTTAGESHGKALIGIIEGLPSNLKIDVEEINRYLALRQSGYGRGDRQKIEKDTVEIISGVRNLLTLGSPLSFAVKNKDYENWREVIAPEGCDTEKRRLTKVRPGHADLTGILKYDQTDARNILERASARETAARVVGGSIARQYLKALGVEISGYVKSVGNIVDPNIYAFERLSEAKSHSLFMLDSAKEKEAEKLLDKLKADGDTAGGIIEIRVKGLKSGFGSCMQYSTKLDAILCGAMMSVQAIKGVEVGLGFAAAKKEGSKVHDEIYYNGSYFRKTNNAGGIEGGMSNGEEIVLRAAMKPIPTLMKGLNTVDVSNNQPAKAAGERSDIAAVCAAEIVLENVVAFALADVVSQRLGGDNMGEVVERYRALR
ncbi:MAG: chorismate synthase [Clostridia bacterium]|nr:chorismate synthase [Clostridia bacterium]